MQRLWDKARAARPSIYERPKAPIVEKYLRSKPAPGFKGRLGFSEFATFFRDYSERARPSPTADMYDLHAHVASLGGRDYLVDHHAFKFSHVFPVAIIVRNLFRGLGESSEKSVESAIGAMSDVMGGLTAKWHSAMIEDVLRDYADEVERHFRQKTGGCGVEIPEIQRTASGILGALGDCMRSEVEIKRIELVSGNVGPDILEKLADASERERPYMFRRIPFCYESVGRSRLFAVLGDTPESSFFQDYYEVRLVRIGNNLLVPPSEPIIMPEISDGSIAVISMFPWEADHLLKAQEMMGRGAPVSKPLGRLFIGEYEFGLFEWLKGDLLKEVPDQKVWEIYGRTIRQCHDRGIAVDDAAGRNAIWNGQEVKLIDFEHTWLTKEPSPLVQKARAVSFRRIKIDTQENSRLLDAFMRGYASA